MPVFSVFPSARTSMQRRAFVSTGKLNLTGKYECNSLYHLPPRICLTRNEPATRQYALKCTRKSPAFIMSASGSSSQSIVKTTESEPSDPFCHGLGSAKCPSRDWVPTGTKASSQIASERGVDMSNLSRSYGMVLARQVLDLGIKELVPERIIDGFACGWRDEEMPMDVARFENAIQYLLQDKTTSAEHSSTQDVQADVITLSQMYGYLLGTTLRLSCLELDETNVIDGFRVLIAEPETDLPLEPEEYDRQFMELQQITAALMHQSNLADANRFFDIASTSPGVTKLRADGLILCLDGSIRATESEPEASNSSTVRVVIAGRLLDGRSFLVPSFSDGLDQEADTVEIPLPTVPESLSRGIAGMREGEVRTVYIHPEVSDGISALFSAQPFPPQSVIIFDIRLVAAHVGNSQSGQ